MEDIFSGRDGRGATAKYPFAKMEIGDIVQITEDIGRLQAYCHVYARSRGRKFSTRTRDGILYVKRTA